MYVLCLYVCNLYAKAETLALELVLEVELLDDLEGPRPVVVPHHGELVRSKTARLYHLKE